MSTWELLAETSPDARLTRVISSVMVEATTDIWLTFSFTSPSPFRDGADHPLQFFDKYIKPLGQLTDFIMGFDGDPLGQIPLPFGDIAEIFFSI